VVLYVIFFAWLQIPVVVLLDAGWPDISLISVDNEVLLHTSLFQNRTALKKILFFKSLLALPYMQFKFKYIKADKMTLLTPMCI
jgi:hypothetical protein